MPDSHRKYVPKTINSATLHVVPDDEFTENINERLRALGYSDDEVQLVKHREPTVPLYRFDGLRVAGSWHSRIEVEHLMLSLPRNDRRDARPRDHGRGLLG